MSNGYPWVLLLMMLLLASLPFFSKSLFFIKQIPPSKKQDHRQYNDGSKPLVWTFVELVVYFCIFLGITIAWEAKLGPVFPQSKSFYVIVFAFFLTCAFPGFVWRYLFKRY